MVQIKVDVSELTRDVFLESIQEHGYVIVENAVDQDLLLLVRNQLEECIRKETAFHGSEDYKDFGMLIACPIYGGSFLKLVDHRQLMEPFNWMLGDTSIIYVYTSSSIPPKGSNYASRIHVDRPHHTNGYMEALGCLVMLDDFNEENGATWVLPGSHLLDQQPTEEYFYQNAVRIIAKKGSVIYFHLRMWHAGGINYTDKWRHAVGIGMVRGYLKQRIDLPRAMKDVDVSKISDFGLQKLGFFSQPPTSLEEYYGKGTTKSYIQKSEWNKGY